MKPRVVSAVKYVLLQDMIFLCMSYCTKTWGCPDIYILDWKNSWYKLLILPFQTRVETLSTFPAPSFFSILRWLKLKRSKVQGLGWADIFQEYHAVHMQPWLTFWNYSGMGSTFKPQPELWNASREPCLLFLHSPWTKEVKNCLLTLVILDCLRASKSLP